MKLLYGTSNQGKLENMKRYLSSLDIDIISLRDMNKEDIPAITESGNTPLENATIKAKAYYQAFKMPVFSCDSGLYFENVPDNIQPGVHIRTINGVYISDEQTIEYYSSIAKEYGDLTARYKNAICLILDENHLYSSMADNLSGEPFIITSKPHVNRIQGFPLDSLSIDIKTGKYYFDLDNKKSR